MAVQNTDLLLIERGGVQYQLTTSELADFLGLSSDKDATDIADRDALTELRAGDRVFVADASGDATVDSGWALYRVLDDLSFFKIQEQESMDMVIVSASNLGYTPSPTGGTITNDNGTGATIPVVNATDAGLATPAMLQNTHLAASADGTVATNPVVVESATQKVSFSIANLNALP